MDQINIEQESRLVERALRGDQGAFSELVEPFRKPLFSYVYRMVTLRQDAEDLLQDVLVRVLESLPRFRGEARFKTWLFGIATHVCLDHLRNRKRWRTEAQLYGEREADSSPEYREQIADVLSRPDFVYEVREHIAFCFSCISRLRSCFAKCSGSVIRNRRRCWSFPSPCFVIAWLPPARR